MRTQKAVFLFSCAGRVWLTLSAMVKKGNDYERGVREED